MAALPLTALIICLLLRPSFAVANGCHFQVPSTRDVGLCETYELSKQAALGPFVVNGSRQLTGSSGETEPATYYFSLCGNVSEDFLPKECVEVGQAPAYQYTKGKECVALGRLSDVVAVRPN